MTMGGGGGGGEEDLESICDHIKANAPLILPHIKEDKGSIPRVRTQVVGGLHVYVHVTVSLTCIKLATQRQLKSQLQLTALPTTHYVM